MPSTEVKKLKIIVVALQRTGVGEEVVAVHHTD